MSSTVAALASGTQTDRRREYCDLGGQAHPFTYAFAERRGQLSPVVRRRMRSVVRVASRKSSPLSAFSAPDDAGSSNPGYRYCFKTVPEVLTFGIGDALAQLPNLPPEKPHLSANPEISPLLSVTYLEHKGTTVHCARLCVSRKTSP
ncbi:hypothetical protein P0D87_26400 [Paraburkholderia sp. RL17-368-BIF-A]